MNLHARHRRSDAQINHSDTAGHLCLLCSFFVCKSSRVRLVPGKFAFQLFRAKCTGEEHIFLLLVVDKLPWLSVSLHIIVVSVLCLVLGPTTRRQLKEVFRSFVVRD